MCDARPAILVIDDQIGERGSRDQDVFLQCVRAIDGRGQPNPHFPYRIDFSTAKDGAGGNYSIAAAIAAVRGGWEPGLPRVWALVLLDVRFGGHSTLGLSVLDAIRADPELGDVVPVVMLSKEGAEVRSAAARAGARVPANGFMPKLRDDMTPGVSWDALHAMVLREGLIPDLRPGEPAGGGGRRLLGSSLPFLAALREVRRAAGAGRAGRAEGVAAQMCLLGESGVGKSQIAKYAHDILAPTGAPFRQLTADPGNPHLQLGQLFGAWPGAYTGVPVVGLPGAFELAHGGTLFLDEVANLTPDAQKRLLEARAIDGGRGRVISRYGAPPLASPDLMRRCAAAVGGRLDEESALIHVDVGLITATNAQLDDPAERSRREFAEDLWAGLTPRVIVPSLNQRRADIGPLFVEMLRQRVGRSTVNVEPEVVDVLTATDWSRRGNFRGLAEVAVTASARYADFQVVTVRQLPTDLLACMAGSASGAYIRPIAPVTAAPDAAPATSDVPAERANDRRYSAELIRRYRADLERLLAELHRTRSPRRADPNGLWPGRAISSLLGITVSGSSIDRLIGRLFFDPVFAPSKTLQESLTRNGLLELQAWARSIPEFSTYIRNAESKRRRPGLPEE